MRGYRGILAGLVWVLGGAGCGGGKVKSVPDDGGADASMPTTTSDSGVGGSSSSSSGGNAGSSGSSNVGGSSGGNSSSSGNAGSSGNASSSGIVGGSSGVGGSSSSSGAVASCVSSVSIRTQPIDKVDLLFMIDNSASMGDKQALLAQAVPDMIGRLVAPNCVDSTGKTIGPSSGGRCTTGALEFPAVQDMHIGIVTSSLGGRGASMTCDPSLPNAANQSLPSHNDDRGELINRGGADEHLVANAGSPLNFLAWYPSTNAGGTPPSVPAETALGDPMTPGTLIGDFTDMISGVHEHGCGFEAQNEAWYRFLVQPDPFASISINGSEQASLNGVDSVILNQRHAFLRPDSLLAVIVVTDENEEVANPMSIGGEGWLYEAAPWPGSPTNGGGPRGTVECASNPLDPNCTSCAFSTVVNGPNYATRCPPDPPSTAQGYYDPSDDNINVRFFHQKQRFGLFAGYPVSRYVRGLTSPTVPDRAHEVDGNGNYVGDQDKYANCVNPIFAANLPTDPTADLCNLPRGPRTPDLVYYAAIAGVPHQLLQAKPGDPECPSGTSAGDCPQKNRLTEGDWLSITGKDPENYDFTGADPHMLESETPRQTGCTSSSPDTCDPINGREWDTKKGDLQYACIFPLPAPKDCTQSQFAGACDCNGGTSQNTPLCQMSGGVYTSLQINGKAYPSIREMVIAHAMADQPYGVQGIATSLCPIHSAATSLTDPAFGYRPAVNTIVDRLKSGLAAQCLPNVCLNDAGTEQCQLWVTLPTPGVSCGTLPGLVAPPPSALQSFQAAQHQQWVAAGGAATGKPDPSTLTSCLMPELGPAQNPGDFGSDGTCSHSADPGWCFAEGPATGTCAQQIVLSPMEPPAGASVSLQCQQ